MAPRKGKAYRPTVERERLDRRVLELREAGLSYNQIIGQIKLEDNIVLRKSHIYGWVKGKHRPFGYVTAFDPTPCPELAYVIGVKLGDASMSVNKHYSYMIKLRVIDREFAEEFSRCLSVILGRAPPRVKWNPKNSLWETQASSLLLRHFLLRPLENLKPTIEHCRKCKAAFLRGFLDSEGGVSGDTIAIGNTNKETLCYVQSLLEKAFKIDTRGPYLGTRKGRKVMIKGKWYQANKDCFSVAIKRVGLEKFAQSIGFIVLRKKLRLDSLIADG